jgi:predicted MFS family arabinose efflux permease
MHAPAPVRAVWRPVLFSTAARLPLAAVGIGLLVHVQRLTGSYGAAGLVSGAFAAAAGLAAPLLGRVADRRGRRLILIAGAAASSVSLALIAVAPPSVPIGALVLLAAIAGGTTPPIAACVRSVLPLLVDAAAVRSVFALESAALELAFIAGPPLALAIASLSSPRVALAACALVLLVATVVFALTAPLDRPAGAPRARPSGRGALASPAIRTLVVALACIGALFGAVEVAITATATEHAGPATAAPLLALWGIGSLLGGGLATRSAFGARSPHGLGLLVAALALSHAALATATNSLVLTGVLLVVAGSTIAPTYATVHAMADHASLPGSATETFAWLGSAIAAGSAAGAAAAGAIVDHAGPRPVLLLAGAAGCAAVALTLARAHTLQPAPARQPS